MIYGRKRCHPPSRNRTSLGFLVGFSSIFPQPPEENRDSQDPSAKILTENRPDLAIPEFPALVALDPNNLDAPSGDKNRKLSKKPPVSLFEGDSLQCLRLALLMG